VYIFDYNKKCDDDYIKNIQNYYCYNDDNNNRDDSNDCNLLHASDSELELVRQ
jgi:hypothetical protein